MLKFYALIQSPSPYHIFKSYLSLIDPVSNKKQTYAGSVTNASMSRISFVDFENTQNRVVKGVDTTTIVYRSRLQLDILVLVKMTFPSSTSVGIRAECLRIYTSQRKRVSRNTVCTSERVCCERSIRAQAQRLNPIRLSAYQPFVL